jgi:O-antigen/teichoic acid export membrane protein
MLTEGESSFPNAKLRPFSLVAYKSIAEFVAKGSLLVITLVAARRLTIQEFGLFGLGTTLGWMLAVVADAGLQLHLARVVAQAPIHAGSLLKRWWSVRLGTLTGTLALLFVGLLVARVSATTGVALMLFALTYGITGVVEFLNYFYRGLSRTDLESTLLVWQRCLTLGLGVAVLWWRPDVTLLAAAMLVPAVCVLLWSVRHASALVPPTAGVFPTDTFLRDVFPIGAGIVISAVYFRIDVLLVQLWSGTEAVAGYNAVFRLVDALRLFPAAVVAVALPAMCRAENFRPVWRTSVAVTAPAIIVTAALWIAAGWMIPLVYGSTYAWTTPAFRILALTFPLLSLNFALTHQLIGWNRQREYAWVCAGALATNLVLNAWLIPKLAIEGAAWATLGTEICVTSGCIASLRAGTS